MNNSEFITRVKFGKKESQHIKSELFFLILTWLGPEPQHKLNIGRLAPSSGDRVKVRFGTSTVELRSDCWTLQKRCCSSWCFVAKVKIASPPIGFAFSSFHHLQSAAREMLHYLKRLKKIIDAAPADEHVSAICRLYGVHIMLEKKDFISFLEWNRMNHCNICKNGKSPKTHTYTKTRTELTEATKQAL